MGWLKCMHACCHTAKSGKAPLVAAAAHREQVARSQVAMWLPCVEWTVCYRPRAHEASEAGCLVVNYNQSHNAALQAGMMHDAWRYFHNAQCFPASVMSAPLLMPQAVAAKTISAPCPNICTLVTTATPCSLHAPATAPPPPLQLNLPSPVPSHALCPAAKGVAKALPTNTAPDNRPSTPALPKNTLKRSLTRFFTSRALMPCVYTRQAGSRRAVRACCRGLVSCGPAAEC